MEIKQPKFKIGDIVNVKYNETITLTNVAITEIIINIRESDQRIAYKVESNNSNQTIPSCLMFEKNISLVTDAHPLNMIWGKKL